MHGITNGITSLIAHRDPENAPGSPSQREISRKILAYFNREYSDARAQRMEQFPGKGAKHQLRVKPWIYRLGTDLGGTLYRDQPTRTLTGATDDDLATYSALLEDGEVGFDLSWMSIHAVALQQAYALVMPDPVERGVWLLVIPMHDIEFEMSSLRPHISSVSKVRFAVHEDPRLMLGSSICEVTATTAKWVSGPRANPDGDGAHDGLFNAEGTNPLGVIPLLAVHAQRPPAGSFMCHVPADWLLGQQAQDRASTSLLHVADAQGYSQPVVKRNSLSRTDKEEVEVGMETAVALEEGEDFKYESPMPNLEGYLAQERSYVETLTAMNGLSPASFLRSAATTGVARMVEMWDRSQERLVVAQQFRRLEQRLYRLTALWMRALQGSGVLPVDARVGVTFHQASPPSDPLHELQALEIEVRLNKTSMVKVLMREHNIDRAAAQEMLDENRADNAAASPPRPPALPPATEDDDAGDDVEDVDDVDDDDDADEAA